MALCGTVVGNDVNIKIALSRDKMCILIKLLVGDLVILEEVMMKVNDDQPLIKIDGPMMFTVMKKEYLPYCSALPPVQHNFMQ